MSIYKGRIVVEHRVACITINSLIEILNMFLMVGEKPTYMITRLKARATVGSKLNELLVYDKKLGIKGYLEGKKSLIMDYTVDWDENGNPTNSIDRRELERTKEYLFTLNIKDAAVEFLTVLIRDPKIGKLAGISEDLFHVTIYSDPVDGDLDRNMVKEHKINETLIKEYGFKYRILHTKLLIDRKQELTVPTSQRKPIIWWEGKTWVSLHSPIKMAQQLREHFRPFSLLKRYGSGIEDVLVLLGVER